MIRTLRDDEPIPSVEPRRYLTSAGYVRLRWHVGTDSYVEQYEHRIVMGRPLGQVHHVNGVKADNRPGNLVVLSITEHARLHGQQAHANARGRERDRQRAARRAEREAWWASVADLYAAGHSTPELGHLTGKHHSNIYRGLVSRGYPVRTVAESRAA